MSEFFSLKPTLSKGATMMFITGQRNSGKTYSFKEWAIVSYLKTGAEWVYVRRVKDELVTANTLWTDIAYKYGMETKRKGWQCFIRPIPKDDKDQPEWKPFGYYIPLSEQQSFKSSALPKVDKICFDEFIIENERQRYVPREEKLLQSLFLTIARNKEKCRMVCLSNSGAISNPYFDAYDVTLRELMSQKYVDRKDGKVLFYYDKTNYDVNNENLLHDIGTDDYKDYAFGNIFLDTDDTFVDNNVRILGESKCVYKFENEVLIAYRAVNSDGKNVIYFKHLADKDISKMYLKKWAVKKSLVGDDYIYDTQIVRQLQRLYQYGAMRFEDEKARNTMRNSI